MLFILLENFLGAKLVKVWEDEPGQFFPPTTSLGFNSVLIKSFLSLGHLALLVFPIK